MANEFTMDDFRRMQELQAAFEALSTEETAALFEDSDMDEAMRYAMQDRDMRRAAEQGDAMANTLLRGEDPPSPQEMDPVDLPPARMRMDGMGAGPKPKR